MSRKKHKITHLLLTCLLVCNSSLYSQKFNIEKLKPSTDGTRLGLIETQFSHKGIHYIKARKEFKHNSVASWFRYESGKAPVKLKESELPKIDSESHGLAYRGKFYSFGGDRKECRLICYDPATKKSSVVELAYPKKFSRLRNMIVFNGKLFFTAISSDHGGELFSYSPEEKLEVYEVAKGTYGTHVTLYESSNPKELFIWQNHLVFSAQDGKWTGKGEDRHYTGKYGRELYKLNSSGEISLIKDLIPGVYGSGYIKTNFFEGKIVVHALAKKKLYELTASWELQEFKLKEDIKINNFHSLLQNDKYWVATYRSHLAENGFYTKSTILFIDKDRNTHSFVVDNALSGVFVGDKYYVCTASIDNLIGDEPYIIDLSNWTMHLLDNIRSEPYMGLLGANFGSEAIEYTPINKSEVIFCAESKTELNSYSTYRLIINESTEKYKLSISKLGAGSLNEKTKICHKGETVKIEATPQKGYVFDGWRGFNNSRRNPLELKMDEDKVLVAVFEKEKDSYDLKITCNKEEGSVSPENGNYKLNEEIEIKATPMAGYQFKEWIGDIKSTENPLKVAIKSDLNIEAVFEKTTVSSAEHPGYRMQMNIYPNPVQHTLFFSNEKKNKELDIEIYDLQGKLVLKNTISEDKISLGQLHKGVFIIRIKTNNVVYTQKITKI